MRSNTFEQWCQKNGFSLLNLGGESIRIDPYKGFHFPVSLMKYIKDESLKSLPLDIHATQVFLQGTNYNEARRYIVMYLVLESIVLSRPTKDKMKTWITEMDKLKHLFAFTEDQAHFVSAIWLIAHADPYNNFKLHHLYNPLIYSNADYLFPYVLAELVHHQRYDDAKSYLEYKSGTSFYSDINIVETLAATDVLAAYEYISNFKQSEIDEYMRKFTETSLDAGLFDEFIKLPFTKKQFQKIPQDLFSDEQRLILSKVYNKLAP